MAITVNMQSVKTASVDHFDATEEYEGFSVVRVNDNEGSQVNLFFYDNDHINRANAVAAAINGEAK